MNDTLTDVVIGEGAVKAEQADTASTFPSKENGQPEWLTKMVKRQEMYNRRFEKAKDSLLEEYQEFLSRIEEINEQFGTEFDIDYILRDYEGKITIPVQ